MLLPVSSVSVHLFYMLPVSSVSVRLLSMLPVSYLFICSMCCYQFLLSSQSMLYYQPEYIPMQSAYLLINRTAALTILLMCNSLIVHASLSHWGVDSASTFFFSVSVMSAVVPSCWRLKSGIYYLGGLTCFNSELLLKVWASGKTLDRGGSGRRKLLPMLDNTGKQKNADIGCRYPERDS